VSRRDVTIFPFPLHVFRGRILDRYKLRNNNEPRGLNFGKREPDAQNEFYPHARTENRDFRDRSGPGVVAENPSALPLHSFSGAWT
jgi:hypothetical protein